MKKLVFGLLVLLSACASERYAPAIDAKVDSALLAAGMPPLSLRKIKFIGPVTIQLGGRGNMATSTAIAKAKAPVAAAPHAVATEATTKGGLAWYVYAAGAVAAVAVGFVVRGKLALLV